MTAPAPSGGPSPLRVGGLALLGVGAVAGIIGLATLAAGGGDESTSAAPPSTTSAPADPGFTPTDGVVPSETPTDGSPPGADGGVPVPSFGPSGSPAPGAGGDVGAGDAAAGVSGSDGSGATAAGDFGAGGTVADVRMPLRVYNNSTISGLAARGAQDFEAGGWTVTDIGGYSGLIPVSTVYFREGTAEKDAAVFLAEAFGLRAEPRFDGIKDASPGVIVILTRDYQGPQDTKTG